MDRAAQIARIIEKRRPLVQKIELVEANLRTLASAIRTLESHRHHLLTRLEDSNIIKNLGSIDFTIIQSRIAEEQQAIAKLKARFARETLNIGVVGRAGQGKSRFLQSLTGLTNQEIPDGKLNNCTGVSSIIQHNPNVETHGEVYFHTEQSFLTEVIYLYYDKLDLGTKPLTVEEFASKPLPPLPSNSVGSAERGAMYARLLKSQENLDKYRHLLKALSPRRIEKEQIRGFVAQTSLDGKPIFFNYLAVREVKIICPFPNADVGKIALIDLPGLGDTSLGDKERLKKTIGQDADFALFLYMPQTKLWQDVDVQLYDIVRSALVELPIEKWSFMLFNHTASGEFKDNWEYCQEAARTITEKHIAVKGHAIADCANPEEVSQVLTKILDDLEDNITSLDEQYLSANKASRNDLEKEIKAELDKARKALGEKQGDRSYLEFSALFKKFWGNITRGLHKLLVELDSFRNREDSEFHRRIDAVIQFCLANTGILLDAKNDEAKKVIEDLNYELGDYGTTYFECMNRLRTHLSRQFLSLDDGLKYSVEEAKRRVTDVLIDKNKGNLGQLTQATGSEFLKEIAELLPDYLTRLKYGFEILSTFEISYRGLIQHRIRQHLDELTPNRNLDLTFDSSLSPENIQTKILEALDEFYKASVCKCENTLKSFLCEPNQAAFAMVEEFVDQILRAEDVQDEWRNFLKERCSEVWPEEFGRLAEQTRMRKEWFHLVDSATNTNQLDLI